MRVTDVRVGAVGGGHLLSWEEGRQCPGQMTVVNINKGIPGPLSP